MRPCRYILRSLSYYRRAHLWVMLGSTMCTAILVGALVVGDSVRHSLRRLVTVRLGDTQFSLSAGDRFFRTGLADALADRLGTTVAPILQVKGMAAAEGGRRRVNRITAIGVDGRFGEIGDAQGVYDGLLPNETVVNRVLASQLGLKVGDRLLLRLEALDAMPSDAPLSSAEGRTSARRYVIRAIVGRQGFGGFQLQSSQVTRGTAFVGLSALARELGVDGRANGLLVAQRPRAPLSKEEVDAALQKEWTLADAGLEWRRNSDGRTWELRSTRIFLDPAVPEAATRSGHPFRPVLTYFVNEIGKGDRATPYSFVSAPGAPIVPEDLADDEILVNRWLADDIGAEAGDTVHLRYYVLERMRRLREATSAFQVRAVVPPNGVYADRELLPEFPGLAGEAHCRDWEAGVPIHTDRIREKDEAYWTQFRGTPKAFVSLNAAQAMWGNRFGSLTAIRFSEDPEAGIRKALRDELDPAQFGLVFRKVRREGLRASAESVDFAQLFLGLSFFVIVASLLLTGLLFAFQAEGRSQETGLLLALGYTAAAVKRMALAEGAVLACVGGLLGGVAGIGINQAILRALMTVWSGAVGATVLEMHLDPLTLLMGVGIGAVLAVGVVWLVIRRQTRQPITDLQRGITQVSPLPPGVPKLGVAVAAVSLVGVVLLLLLYPVGEDRGILAAYFSAGTLVLVGGLAVVGLLVHSSRKVLGLGEPSLFRIGVHGLGRRRLRSLTIAGLLACGLFLVFTVGANRKSATVGASKRDSGTGGFALYGESAVPVIHDLNQWDVREDYGLEAQGLGGTRFVQLRVKEGDDASCLNLNRVSNPQLLGVDPEELVRREAFTFARTIAEADPENPWGILSQDSGSVVPAVADMTVIQWGLGRSVGDTLVYTDEQGRSFGVRLVAGLANSVFQGNLIVSEDHLIEKYPSLSGYRLFLIDAPMDSLEEISRDISWALQDWGFELVPASERLDQFNQVENTYLSIFFILGGFGVLLGSIGIGIMVMRSIQERQGELALLRAVGYSRGMLRKMIRWEFMVLLLAGTALGVASALVATYPTLIAPGAEIPASTLLVLFILVLANGGLWIHLAAARALRRPLLPALREE